MDSRIPAAPILRDFELAELLQPMDVPLPLIKKGSPAFIDDKWLDKAILSQHSQKDDKKNRVLPLAFVRCSRGGKNRALYEIASHLKKDLDSAIIYVFFSNHSSIEEWEKADPIAALCRRIAFEARRDRECDEPQKRFVYLELQLDQLLNANVSSDHIKEWLSGSMKSKQFARFLTDTFLRETLMWLESFMSLLTI
jgi:hypothetical protein